MRISEFITADNIFIVNANSKKDVLQQISNKLAQIIRSRDTQQNNDNEQTIFSSLLEREKLGSTGVGKGVAIPHCKFKNIDKIYGIFLRLPKHIDFDAIDEEKVDLIFALIVPEKTENADNHLQALALIARKLRKSQVRESLRKTNKPKIIYKILIE